MTMSARALAVAFLTCVGSLIATQCAGAETTLSPSWFAPVPGNSNRIIADGRGAVVMNDSGEIAAIDPSGRQKWTALVATPDEGTVFDPPAMDESTVVVPVNGSRVVALDRASGLERWQVSFPDAALVAVDGSPTSSDVVVANTTGSITVLAGTDGTVRWSIDLPFGRDPLEPRVWFENSRVVASWTRRKMHLSALDVATGAVVWSHRFRGLGTTPVLRSGTLSLAVNLRRGGEDSSIGQFRQYDLETGALRWKSREFREHAFLPTFATAAGGGFVAAADLSGEMMLVRSRSGRIAWRSATGKEQYENAPWIVGSAVTMTTYGSGLVALETSDGTPLETELIGEAQSFVIIESTAASADRLYLLISGTGTRSDQSEVWALEPAPSG